MRLPTNDTLANRELSMEELEPVAAGLYCSGETGYCVPAIRVPRMVLPGTGSIYNISPHQEGPFLR